VLVSARGPADAPVEGNGDAVDPAISADGLVVAFESDATNLVDGDTNSARDIFVWQANDRDVGLQRVSVSSTGAEGDSISSQASLSAKGTIVAFASGASTLTPGVDGINTINVYRRDLVAGTTTLISVGSDGTGAGGDHPMLSDDGDRLAFYSFASDIVAGDGNDLWDIFLWQHSTQSLSRVSLTSDGGERNQGNESASRVVAPAISGNGRFVAYATTASNMVAGDNNGLQDVFVVDIDSGAVVRASIGSDGVDSDGDSPIGQGERVSLSQDGHLVAFSTRAENLGATGNVMVRDLDSGAIIAANAETGGVGPPVMSFAGAYVVFGSDTPLDGRFDSSGIFAHFTGLARAFWWFDD
jgi:Tol biopolymer transport system component